MEKLAALFNDIFVRDNSDDTPIPLKIVFGGKRRKALEYSKVTMRPLMLGDKLLYQAEYTYPKKVTHTNLEARDAAALALSLVKDDFKQINIFMADKEIQVLASKPANPRITSKKTAVPSAASACMPALFPQQNKKLHHPRRNPLRLSHLAGSDG